MKLLALATALALIAPVAARTINVGPGAEYQDIQEALNAAAEGDVVSVAGGWYELPEGIEIKTDGVTLKGGGAERTILDGASAAYAVVRISAEGVTVTGFTITGGESHGLYANSDNSGSIHHNVITRNGDRGILLGSGTPHAVIDHNTFAHNEVSAIYSYLDNPKTKLTSNVVYENDRALVTDSGFDNMTVKYNCFQGQTNDLDCAATSNTNIHEDPGFVDSEADYHLADGSPCLGAGEGGTDIGALGKGKNPELARPGPVPAVEPDDDIEQGDFSRYSVTVFCGEEEFGNQVLAALHEAGFTNEDNDVIYDYDDEVEWGFIEYGSAGDAALEAIRAAVTPLYGSDLDDIPDFDDDDDDIFIFLP